MPVITKFTVNLIFWLCIVSSDALISPGQASPSSVDGISIQGCEYSELKSVSEILFQSFYDEKTQRGPWKQIYKLAELNRLQQNFPYQDTDMHQMLVAVEDESDMVVGFADIDARPCKTKLKLPRPYLSDLCIHPDFRRRGIAHRLVQACEEFICQIPKQELWIRVKEENVAAINMYKNLEYSLQGPCKEEDNILVLHKELSDRKEPAVIL